MRFVGPMNSAQDPLVCTVHTEKSIVLAPKKKKNTQKTQMQLINTESKHHLSTNDHGKFLREIVSKCATQFSIIPIVPNISSLKVAHIIHNLGK